MALTDRARRIYRQHRRDGLPASHAYHLARAKDVVDAVLAFNAYTEGYAVDVAALERVTAGPHPNCTEADGSPVDGTIRFPEGCEVSLRTQYDVDSDPDGEECYDAEDVAAWQADRWQFRGIIVTATLPDGEELEESIWGVEVGDYWPGSEEVQIWEAARDLLAELAGRATEYVEEELALARDLRAILERVATGQTTASDADELARRLGVAQ